MPDRRPRSPLGTRCVLLAALTMATPAAACDLDGLPGMHRFNPFLRYPAPGGPAAEPDERSPRSIPADRSDPAQRRGAEKDEAPRREPREPKAWESDMGNGPIRAEDKASFT